jgi:hypothetical protein
VDVIAAVYSSVERELYVKKAAAKLGVTSESLGYDVSRAVAKRSRQQRGADEEYVKKKIQGLGDRVNRDRVTNIGGTAAEEAILGILMNSPEFIKKCRDGTIDLKPELINFLANRDCMKWTRAQNGSYSGSIHFRPVFDYAGNVTVSVRDTVEGKLQMNQSDFQNKTYHLGDKLTFTPTSVRGRYKASGVLSNQGNNKSAAGKIILGYLNRNDEVRLASKTPIGHALVRIAAP